MLFRLILFFACTALLIYPGCTPSPETKISRQTIPVPVIDTALQRFAAEFDHFMQQEMVRTQTPGAAIAIVKDSLILLLKGYGLRNTRDSVTTTTVFRIGSLSKGFTGVLTGMLVEDSLMHWEECVQQRFPAFTLRDQAQASRIQVRHLLSQTTGLPYHAYTNLIEEGYEVPRIITEYFPKVTLQGKEGEFFSYQNVAFSAVEPVMQSCTGKDYSTLLHERILTPLRMQCASCDFNSIKNTPNHAVPMLWTGYGWIADTVQNSYYNCCPAGGINASVSDMAEWLKLLVGCRPDIVSKQTLDTVFSPVISTDRERQFFRHWPGQREAHYAMGWRVLINDADTIIYHGGYVNGFRSEIAFDRQSGIGICLLGNASTDLSRTCVPAFFDLWRKGN